MRFKPVFALLPAMLLAGCISFGAEAPDQLLTLTPTASAPVSYTHLTLPDE